jgi:hypothetical protein
MYFTKPAAMEQLYMFDTVKEYNVLNNYETLLPQVTVGDK